MAKNEFDLRDIEKIIARPVLNGQNSKFIWTGLVRSENLSAFVVPDENLRRKLKELTVRFEHTVRNHRQKVEQMQDKKIDRSRKEELRNELLDLEVEISREYQTILTLMGSQNESTFYPYLYLVSLCREYEELLEKNPAEIQNMSKEIKSNLEGLRRYFIDEEPHMQEIYTDGNYRCVQHFTKGQQKKYFRGKENNYANFENILINIGDEKDLTAERIEQITREAFGILDFPDFYPIFSSEEYTEMQQTVAMKNYMLKQGYSVQEIEQMSAEDRAKAILERSESKDENEICTDLVTEMILSGIPYLDLEKLLLMTISRRLEDLEKNKEGLRSLTDAHLKESKESEFIIKKILGMKLISPRTKCKIIVGEEVKEASLKTVESLMKNFCDGIYMTPELIEDFKVRAFFSPDEMSKWSDELVCRMEYLDEEKASLCMINFENLKRLYTLGKLDKEDIKSLLSIFSNGIEKGAERLEYGSKFKDINEMIRQNSRKFFKNIFDSDLLTDEEIMEYFQEGIISKEMIDTLEEDRTDEERSAVHARLRKIFTQEVTLTKYKKYVEKYVEFMNLQKNSPSETERIEALREEVNKLRLEKDLYKELFTRYNQERSESEKDKLLEQYYFDLEVEDESVLQESMKVMYEDGIIDLENIIHFDKDYVIPMLDSLSLDDASKVRSSMSFEELQNMLNTIFDDKKISDERKFIIVMNLLGEDTEEDKEAREFYLSLLEFDDLEKRPKPKRKKDKDEETTRGGGKESNKYVYPDIVKWKFYKALDKDVRVTRYLNGFVEFASSKLGVRIIEKYYDGDKPAYGTATYILPEEEYRRNQGELITESQKGKTLESAILREITPRKDRIAHRTQSIDKTWMDQIVKYFDIDCQREDSRYTQEELKELQNTVNNLKNQYEVML